MKPPDCEECGRPDGLYYEDCPLCYAHADHYTWWDYDDA